VTCGYLPFSEQDLIDALRAVAARTPDQYLTSAAYKEAAENAGLPSCSSVINRFGSWAEACEAAKLPPAPHATDDDMIKAIRAAANDLQKPVTETAYEKWRKQDPVRRRFPSWAIRHRFSCWEQACLSAGVANGSWRASGGGHEHLYEALRTIYVEIGEPLTIAAYDAARQQAPGSRPAAITIIKRVGSWKKACEMAGIPDGSAKERPKFSREYLADAIKSAAAEHHPLTSDTYQAWSKLERSRPSLQPILDRFGTWSKALEAAGIRRSEPRCA
jgi:hypothetical protein